MFLRSGGIGMLPPLLRALNSPTNSQLLYELVMCVWQLTFHKEAALALGGAGALMMNWGLCGRQSVWRLTFHKDAALTLGGGGEEGCQRPLVHHVYRNHAACALRGD
eukprot:1036506-Pelagomonas_calceolata.AAC.1